MRYRICIHMWVGRKELEESEGGVLDEVQVMCRWVAALGGLCELPNALYRNT